MKNLQIKKLSFVMILVFFGHVFPSQAQEMSMDDLYKDIAFDMPKVSEPQFPDNAVNIIDFGAKGDGLTKNTEAFAKAIDAVVKKGGGKVIVPRGIWLTGPIILKSNINLHTEDGALVLFSKDFDDYELIATSFEGLDTYRNISPIYGKELENIAITGKGVFDGNGDAWRMVKKGKMTEDQWKKLVSSGGVLSDDGKKWYPSESSKKGDGPGNFNVPDFTDMAEFEEIKDFLRPVMISLVGSKNILLDGPTFQNSPAWNIHPLMSENIIIRNLTVRNPWYSQNGDGLDLESCKNVLIYNNTVEVGDDAICFKSGKDADGRKRAMATENVIVKSNTVYHGHGGFVIGSEMSGNVRNVHVANCTFIGTDVGLRFKSTRGRGGIVENIWISDVNMINIPAEAIRFNMFYGGNSPIIEEDQDPATEARQAAAVAVTEETPIFRNIFMKNITATGSGHAAMFQGLPEMSLKNVQLENGLFETKKGITMVDCEGITLKNIQLQHQNGEAVTIHNSQKIDLTQLKFKDNGKAIVHIMGDKSGEINFSEKDFDNVEAQIKRSNEVAKDAIILGKK